MVSLGSDATRLLAVFDETDSGCSSPIDSDEEQFIILIQNRGREVGYASREVNFLKSIRRHSRIQGELFAISVNLSKAPRTK